MESVVWRFLRSKDAPLLWRQVLPGAIIAVISAVCVQLLVGTSAVLAGVVGILLGIVGFSLPYYLALRSIAVNGFFVLLAVLAAILAEGKPLIAGLFMAFFAGTTALWAYIPFLGGFLSVFPVIVYFLVVAKPRSFAETNSIGTLIVAVLIPIVVSIAFVTLLSIRDIQATNRKLTAACWDVSISPEQRITFSELLLWNNAPSLLQRIALFGSVATICQEKIHQSTPDDSLFETYKTAGKSIPQALAHSGPLVPREANVPNSLQEGRELPVAWKIWRQSILQSQRLLAQPSESGRPIRVVSVVRGMVSSLVNPRADAFRYAVQRALLLGIGAGVMIAFGATQNIFWILLTMVVVLQPTAPATAVRMWQRVLGNGIGVLVAIGAASFVSPQVATVLAGISIVAGVLYTERNYVFSAAATAFSIVFLIGVPASNVLGYAGMRAIDTLIGGVIAVLFARLLLPIRVSANQQLQRYVDTLRRTPTGASVTDLQRAKWLGKVLENYKQYAQMVHSQAHVLSSDQQTTLDTASVIANEAFIVTSAQLRLLPNVTNADLQPVVEDFNRNVEVLAQRTGSDLPASGDLRP